MTRQSDIAGRVLANLDPLTVPLPHGTEITTRVDRVLGDRRVPAGAIGRVTKLDGDWVEVQVVGVGQVRYARAEIVPRKQGQVRFAQRREAAWQLLTPCVVLRATVGSQAWGLADDKSDTDTRGIFVLPFPWITGLAEPIEDIISADGSHTFWEVGKASRQALRADPNTLELLFVDSVHATDPMGEWILAEREAFVSRQLYGSFGRYALSQLKKMRQSLRLAEHRGTILEWLAKETLTLDEVAERLSTITRERTPTQADALFQAKEYVKQLYRSMYDQGLLPAREFSSLVAFARERSAEFELPRDLRPKNAYNLLRLIVAAIEWLDRGRVSLRVGGEWNARLRRIKAGEEPLAAVLDEAERLTPLLEDARQRSPLPEMPQVSRIDSLLKRLREETARRWLARERGSWGTDAPVPPEVEWETKD